MRDYANRVHVLRAISPQAARTDNTAIVSQVIPVAGYDGCVFAIQTGVNTDADATFAITMDHGDAANLSDAVAVPAASLTGTLALAGFNFGDDNETRKIGYVGSKSYVRLTITPTGNAAGDIFVTAVAVLLGGRYNPQANPPT